MQSPWYPGPPNILTSLDAGGHAYGAWGMSLVLENMILVLGQRVFDTISYLDC